MKLTVVILILAAFLLAGVPAFARRELKSSGLSGGAQNYLMTTHIKDAKGDNAVFSSVLSGNASMEESDFCPRAAGSFVYGPTIS